MENGSASINNNGLTVERQANGFADNPGDHDAVFEVDKNANIDAILVLTSGGYSERMISGRRLRCMVIAATSSKKILRQLNILWGVNPLLISGNLEDISNKEKREAVLNSLNKGLIKKSYHIAIVASVFHSKSKITNLLEIHKVDEFLDYLRGKYRIKTGEIR